MDCREALLGLANRMDREEEYLPNTRLSYFAGQLRDILKCFPDPEPVQDPAVRESLVGCALIGLLGRHPTNLSSMDVIAEEAVKYGDAVMRQLALTGVCSKPLPTTGRS